MKYAILRLLAGKPMHGYEVMQALEREFGGWYASSAGSVYPVLQRLTDQGLLTVREDGGRRIYSLTSEGEAFLNRHSERAEDVAERVASFGARFADADSQEVLRLFMRLGQAAFEIVVRSRPDPSGAARVREVLERALRDLETRQGGPKGDATGSTASA